MKWLINALVALASLALCIVVAEAAVRFFAPQPLGLSLQDRYGLTLHYPGITRYLPQYRQEVSFNEAGMRDRAHAEQPSADGFRILLLGDSFMEALQVPFDSSVPSLVERALADNERKPVEVVNAAVGGWGSEDQLRYMTRYGLKYDPDLVIVAMTLHNDISDNLRQQWYTVQDTTLIEKPVAPMPDAAYRKVWLKAFLASRFHLYQLWRKVEQRKKIQRIGTDLDTHVANLFREPTPSEIDRGLQLTERLLAALRDSAAAADAKVVLVLLPIKLQLAPSEFRYFMRQSGVPEREMEIGKPQRVIGDLAARLGIPVVDLLPRFRQWTAEKRAPLYGDHWTVAGHKLAAQVVTDGVIQLGLLR